jgi:hypothetical protein
MRARSRRRVLASVAGLVVVSVCGYVFVAMKLWRYVA